MIAVSAVACAQTPNTKQKISNQEIANSLQNYFIKNPKILNGSETDNQKDNLFLSSIYYINWSEILNYLRVQLHSKPELSIGNNNYNLNSIGVQSLNSTNYNYTNGSITFKLTYGGVPAQNSLIITNLQNFKPAQNPSIQIKCSTPKRAGRKWLTSAN